MAKRIDNTPDSTSWQITLTIADCWIADGFGRTKEHAEGDIRRALQGIFPHSLEGEVSISIKHPSRADLDRACERFDAQETEED